MKTLFLSAGVGLAAAALLCFPSTSSATTVTVYVGTDVGMNSTVKMKGNGYMNPGLVFSPAMVSIKVGDTVQWIWNDGPHSTTSGTPGKASGLWDSGIKSVGSSFTYQFNSVGTFPYFCSVHGACCGMTGSVTVSVGTPTPTPTPTPNPTVPARPLNISTRIQVKTGDQVLIGGFIVTGTTPKRVILRAIGPSLAGVGIANPLADPVLELHASDQSLITSNDNWQDSDEANITATGLAPSNMLESAIVETLDPGSYTAVVSGKNGGTGIGLVEVYDLDQSESSQLANISTRASVQTGNNVMIGGFILGGGGANTTVLIRALGPSLTQFGITGALSDPMLELHDSNGAVVGSNNNWKETQESEIEATGLQPSDDAESALLETLGPSAYTAIVTGQGGVTGVGLVEVYRLQ
jgi:plastocyanin